MTEDEMKNFMANNDKNLLVRVGIIDYKGKPIFFNNSIIAIVLLFLLLLLTLSPFYTFYKEAIALSPPFGLQELINENRHWIQTYGNSDPHLRSNYTDMLAVNYISDGKILNATIWLASGFDAISVTHFLIILLN